MSEEARLEETAHDSAAMEALALLATAFLASAPPSQALEFLHALASNISDEEEAAAVVSIRARAEALHSRRVARAWAKKRLPRWLGMIR